MESSARSYRKIRLSIVALAAVMWIPLLDHDFFTPPRWYVPLGIFVFAAFGVVFNSLVLNDKEWVAPDWDESPFDLQRPLEACHVSAWSFLIGGPVFLLARLFSGGTMHGAIMPLAIGLGLLLGIRVASIPTSRHDA